MNYKVTLYNPNYVKRGNDCVDETDAKETIVVSEVHYDGRGGHWIRLVGTDPSCYPEMAKNQDAVGETRVWTSKNLTLHLGIDDPLDVINVSPTDEDVPQPEVHY